MIEDELADILYLMASFPKGTPIDEVIKSVADQDYELSGDFKEAYGRIKAGQSLEQSLSRISDKYDSKSLRGVINLIIACKKSGADLSTVLRDMAQEMLEYMTMEREKRSMLALQKYTLLAAVMVLVPVIMGLIVKVVTSIDLPNTSVIGTSKELREAYTNAVINAIPFYLVSLSGISALILNKIDKGNIIKQFLKMAIVSIGLYAVLTM